MPRLKRGMTALGDKLVRAFRTNVSGETCGNMFEIFGIPSTALFGQLLVGLINGSFYALLSLGLAVIFGMLNIINFAHGAQYMMGAFAAFLLLDYFDIGYWPALVVVPVLVGAIGIVIERLFLQLLYRLAHLLPPVRLV